MELEELMMYQKIVDVLMGIMKLKILWIVFNAIFNNSVKSVTSKEFVLNVKMKIWSLLYASNSKMEIMWKKLY